MFQFIEDNVLQAAKFISHSVGSCLSIIEPTMWSICSVRSRFWGSTTRLPRTTPFLAYLVNYFLVTCPCYFILFSVTFPATDTTFTDPLVRYFLIFSVFRDFTHPPKHIIIQPVHLHTHISHFPMLPSHVSSTLITDIYFYPPSLSQPFPWYVHCLSIHISRMFEPCFMYSIQRYFHEFKQDNCTWQY